MGNHTEKAMVFKLLRKYIKTLLWITAILIIPSFVLWGVGSGIRGRGQAQEAGRIFDRRVDWNEYGTSYQTIQMLLYLSNPEAYAQFIDPADLAWDRLILLHEAKRRKISVPNETVIAYIQNFPIFRSAGGTGEKGTDRFDMARYEEILLRTFRTNPRTFEEEIRKTLIIQKLREEVTSEVSVDENTLREEYKKRRSRRKVSYVIWNVADFEKEVTITEEDLTTYYNAHPDDFIRAEERRIAYTTADFEKQPKEEARTLIDEVFDALFVQEGAEETFSGDLKQAASLHGLSVEETKFFALDDAQVSELPDLFRQETFRLEEGDVSDPIETETGFTILKVLEVRPPHPTPLKEAHDSVEKTVRTEQAERLCQQKARDVLETLQKNLAFGAVWEDAVKALGLSLKETPPFRSRDLVEPFGIAPEFSRAAFALDVKELGGIVRVPGGFAILRVEEEDPFNEEAYLEEKELFREALLREKEASSYLEWFRVLQANANLVSNLEVTPSAPSE